MWVSCRIFYDVRREQATGLLFFSLSAWHAPCFTHNKEVTSYVHGVTEAKEKTMDTLTLVVIILVVLLLFGGGGFWYRGRGR